ncbi:MAG: Ig-like domain-containing protein, partial [Clostridia bacterium]
AQTDEQPAEQVVEQPAEQPAEQVIEQPAAQLTIKTGWVSAELLRPIAPEEVEALLTAAQDAEKAATAEAPALLCYLNDDSTLPLFPIAYLPMLADTEAPATQEAAVWLGEPLPLTSITLNGLSSISANGAKTQFKIVPNKGASIDGCTFLWSSSNELIATVDETGLVSAKGNGNVKITAELVVLESEAATTIKATKTLRVSGQIVYASAIELSGATEMIAGKPLPIKAALIPSTTTKKRLAWTVMEKLGESETASAASYASVQNGVVTVKTRKLTEVKTLIVRVTAMERLNPDDAEVFATFEFTVYPEPTGVAITGVSEGAQPTQPPEVTYPKTITFYYDKAGDAPCKTLTAAFQPSAAMQADLRWKSSNVRIATVDANGLVTAVSGGVAVITAYSAAYPNVKATLIAKVLYPVANVSLRTRNNQAFGVAGKTLQFYADVTPSNASDKGILWELDDAGDELADITASGLLQVERTLPDNKRADITVYAYARGSDLDLDAKSAAYTLTLYPCAKTMEADAQSVVLDINDPALAQRQMSVTIQPEDALPKLKWTSSNPRVATVSQDGLITAVSNGKANVTMETIDGSRLFKRIAVSVENSVTGLELEPVATIVYGSRVTLKARVLPQNAANKAISWKVEGSDNVYVSPSGVVIIKKNEQANVRITATSKANGEASQTIEVAIVPKAAKLSLSAATVYLTTDETMQLQASIDPAGVLETLLWKSSNQKIVEVDQAGMLTAKAAGRAKITVFTTDGSRLAKSVEVRVNTPVTQVQISGPTNVADGVNVKLVASVLPADATNKAVLWSSSDAKIAKVSATSGVVSIAKGQFGKQVTITATSVADPSKWAEQLITITNKTTRLTLNQRSVVLDASLAGRETFTAIPTVLPSGASEQLSWKSSKTSVATVDDHGVITALRNGNATITATTTDGSNKSASIAVAVRLSVTGVAFASDEALMLSYGNPLALKAAVTPANAANRNLIWRSSDPSYVKVSSTGVVSAQKNVKGTVTITVASAENPDLMDTRLVNVLPRTERVLIQAGAHKGGDGTDVDESQQVNSTEISNVLEIGDTQQLQAIVQPEGASGKVTWRSSKPACISVDADGLITAKAAGRAQIIATTTDGSRKTGIYNASVVVGVKKITLNVPKKMTVKESLSLAVNVEPFNATNKAVTFSAIGENAKYVSISKAGKVTVVGNPAMPNGSRDASAAVLAGDVSAVGFSFTLVATALGGVGGAEIMDAVLVTVEPAPERVLLSTNLPIHENSRFPVLDVGKSTFLGAKVLPEAASQEVRWSSDDETIATIDAVTGEIKGLKSGVVLLTATTPGKNGVNSFLKIKVSQGVVGQPPINLVGEVLVGETEKGNTVRLLWEPSAGADPDEWYLLASCIAGKWYMTESPVPATGSANDPAPEGKRFYDFKMQPVGNNKYCVYSVIWNQDETYTLGGCSNVIGVEVKAPVRRALLVGEEKYQPLLCDLPSSDNDVGAMQAMLTHGQTTYQVSTLMNAGWSKMKSAIASAYAGATENDVNLFFYAGHGGLASINGRPSSVISMCDGSWATASQLAAELGKVPGKMIVILECCYSGNLISEIAGASAETQTATNAQVSAFNASFLGAFDDTMQVSTRNGELRFPKFTVLTATGANEKGKGVVYLHNGRMEEGFGLLTYQLCKGVGYEFDSRSLSYVWNGNAAADQNNDGEISVYEAQQYASSTMAALYQKHGIRGAVQNVQMYAYDPSMPIFFR